MHRHKSSYTALLSSSFCGVQRPLRARSRVDADQLRGRSNEADRRGGSDPHPWMTVPKTPLPAAFRGAGSRRGGEGQEHEKDEGVAKGSQSGPTTSQWRAGPGTRWSKDNALSAGARLHHPGTPQPRAPVWKGAEVRRRPGPHSLPPRPIRPARRRILPDASFGARPASRRRPGTINRKRRLRPPKGPGQGPRQGAGGDRRVPITARSPICSFRPPAISRTAPLRRAKVRPPAPGRGAMRSRPG